MLQAKEHIKAKSSSHPKLNSGFLDMLPDTHVALF